MTTIAATQHLNKPRRLKPTADMLRRAARRADIGRKLLRRDVRSVVAGIALGVAGLMMPQAIDHHEGLAPTQIAALGSDLAMVAGKGAAKAARPTGASLSRAPDGLFYATALINGQPVRFLIDTGANVVTLTEKDAKRLNLLPDNPAGGHADTANGRAVFGWTHIDSVDVAGKHVEDVRAAVLSKDAGVSLLGQNVLSRLGTVRMEGDKLIID